MSRIYNWQEMKDTVDKTLDYKDFYIIIADDNSIVVYKDRKDAIVSFLRELLYKFPESWFDNPDYFEDYDKYARIEGSMKMSEFTDDNQTFEEVLKSHFVNFGQSILELCPANEGQWESFAKVSN